jgi:16S rRNA (cytosine1402-N4)-methyltransferase
VSAPERTFHAPVLGAELTELAQGVRHAVDGTLGGGGHAALLQALGARVLGIDRDPDALRAAKARLGHDRVEYLEAGFSTPVALEAVTAFRPELILLDLGVSSHQLDTDARGFSFRPGVRLDMRMSQAGSTAADFLNHAPEEELRRVFADYGDERQARRLAREIVRRRGSAPFTLSDDLVNAIRAVLGPRSGPTDFARLFQAVRIACNDELTALAEALPALRDRLVPGGRLAVISYHSGEDRLVKHSFQEWCRTCICPREAPICTCRGRPLGRLEPRKPIRPSANEVVTNPRARSATLRIFRKAET